MESGLTDRACCRSRWAGPATAYLSEADLNALVAYLRTVPPVVNKVPPPESPNIAAYMWGKFRMLILKEDIPITVSSGNAGSAGSREPASQPDAR